MTQLENEASDDGVSIMNRCLSALMMLAVLAGGAAAENREDAKGKVCRMEQQCHWENFKKICTWVKVCR
jgi:hypothetical protein